MKSILGDIYAFSEYIDNDVFDEKYLLNLIDTTYKKYKDIEYPLVIYGELASELYLMYYMNNYVNGNIDQQNFLEYLKLLSKVLKNDFEYESKNRINVSEITGYLLCFFDEYKYFYELFKIHNLIILIHNRMNFKYKGSFSLEKYGSVNHNVINIYQNDENIDYLFILFHEIGHFIYEHCKIQIDNLLSEFIEPLNIEDVADNIAVFLLRDLGYDVDFSLINNINLQYSTKISYFCTIWKKMP